MKNFYVLLDNGHGVNTSGKCSPLINFEIPTGYPLNTSDEAKAGTSIIGSRFREWRFNRRVVAVVESMLKEKGYNVIRIVPESNDILLKTRVNRINKYCSKYGAGNCIMISVHANAAGNGGWMNARGWSSWTTKGQNNSDKLADCLYDAAEDIFLKDEDLVKSFNNNKYKSYKPVLKQMIDGDRDYEANFTIIKEANCPAVLIENFFQDNKDDILYLESVTGFMNICKTIVNGIENYAIKYNKK